MLALQEAKRVFVPPVPIASGGSIIQEQKSSFHPPDVGLKVVLGEQDHLGKSAVTGNQQKTVRLRWMSGASGVSPSLCSRRIYGCNFV